MRRRSPLVLATLTIVSTLLAALLILSSRNAQAQLPDFSFEDDPRLIQAVHRAYDLHPEEAIAMLNKVVEDEPGTQVAGAAKLQIADIQAGIGHPDEATRLIREVASDFRDTPVGILAEMRIINAESQGASLDEWLGRMNGLLERIGGVPVHDVLQAMGPGGGSGRVRFREVPFLNPSAQEVLLAEIYLETATAFKAYAMRPKGELYDYDTALTERLIRMCLFLRERFPAPRRSGNAETYPIYTISDIFLTNAGIEKADYPVDTSPPRIRPIAPHDGLTIGSARPKIEVELDDGDIREDQIVISSIVFTLDGQDLTKSMSVRTHINRSAQFDVVFERMRLIARPAAPLQPGLHTVVIQVSDAGNRAQASWSFTTAHGAPDHDDGDNGGGDGP